MRNIDLESLVIWIFGALFTVFGIGCIIFCAKNGGTIQNWIGGIVLSIAGIGITSVNTYISCK